MRAWVVVNPPSLSLTLLDRENYVFLSWKEHTGAKGKDQTHVYNTHSRVPATLNRKVLGKKWLLWLFVWRWILEGEQG